MFIKYKKQIELDLHPTHGWRITTDRGDQFHTLPYSNVTEWWAQQNPSEIRDWQKDIAIKMTYDVLGPVIMYNVFRQGQGYNQPHDVCFVRNERFNFCILSTVTDFWITKNSGGNIKFNVEDSLGSIMKISDRHVLYGLYKFLKKEYNPDNLCWNY
jgi:hypothetical protein